MATITIPKILANFETSLNGKISASATDLILNTSVDDDGTTLSGTYSLTIDEGTTSEEHMVVTLAGSAGTITRRGLSRVDAWTEVTENKIEHNRGASVKITNVSNVNIQRLLSGTDSFNSVNWSGVGSISGLSTPTSSETTKAANVAYVNSISAAGSVDSSTAAKGVGKSSYAHNKSLGTATITIATPAVVSLTAHGLIAGDTVLFTTDGALPTGITASTNYYVISTGLTADAFQIATTSGGTAIDTSGSQSGTHTLYRMTPFFVSDVDPRVPTQDENDALVGTSGTPSSSNKYVTNDDTTGSGSVIRNSVLSAYTTPYASFTAGSAITAGQPLHLTTSYQTDGGIALDNQSSTYYAATTNQSKSFTVGSGSNRYLLVGVLATSTPSAVTYNGVAMTLDKSVSLGAASRSAFVYKLAAPGSGANNITVTATGILGISGASFTGVDQADPIDSSNLTATATIAYTSTASVCEYLHSFCFSYGGGGSTNITAISYTTSYVSGVSATLASSGSNSDCIASGATGIFNAASSSGTLSNTGATNPAFYYATLKPATAPSTAVVPMNTSAITRNAPLINFVGFASASAAQNVSVSVLTSGVISGLSGLTTGSKYFATDTPGSISTTRGSYAKMLGVATSSTTLLIWHEDTFGLPIAKGTGITYTAETNGILAASGAVTVTAEAGALTTSPVSVGKTYTGSGNFSFIPLS